MVWWLWNEAPEYFSITSPAELQRDIVSSHRVSSRTRLSFPLKSTGIRSTAPLFGWGARETVSRITLRKFRCFALILQLQDLHLSNQSVLKSTILTTVISLVQSIDGKTSFTKSVTIIVVKMKIPVQCTKYCCSVRSFLRTLKNLLVLKTLRQYRFFT